MKTLALSFVALFAMMTQSFAQSSYALDKAHSRLSFSVKHMGISNVEGNFKNFDVTVKSAKVDFSDAQIELVAQIKSINTEIDKRDQHLQAADFFDAAKFPTLTFKSSSFKPVKGKAYKLSGSLTLKGVTKPIVFDVVYNGKGKNPYTSKYSHGFTLSGKLNRLDFGVGDVALKTGIGSEVKFVSNLEFVQD